MCHDVSLPTLGLVKPEKAQDEQDDDHKADEIDDAVHVLTSSGAIQCRIVRVKTTGSRA